MFAFEYHPIILPFVLSGFLTAWLGVYAVRRRREPIAYSFALLMAALTIWSWAYAAELSAPTLAGKSAWVLVKFLGAGPGPVLWFVFSLYYTGNQNRLTPRARALLWGLVLLNWAVVYTNGLHGWFWTAMTLSSGGLDTMPQHGWYFWVYAAQGFLSVPASMALYFNYYRSAPLLYRKQAFLMVLGSFLPLGARAAVELLQVELFMLVDEVILFMLFSAILFAVALFRYNALDLLPVAHSRIVQSIAAGIIVLDAGGHVVELNPFAERLTGMSSAEAGGRLLREVLPAWGSLHVGAEQHEVRLERGGEEAFYSIQFSPIDPRDGGRSGYTLVLYDITARKRAEQQLEKLARTDSLTGLLNRRTFFSRAEDVLARAQRYRRPLSLLMIDVDRFKRVNDAHGHPAGDRVLKIIAGLCQKQVRATDIFARYGGEEFVALLIEAGPKETLQVAERQRAMVESAGFSHAGREWPLTVSIGAAHYDGLDETVTLAELIERADQALYRAKQAGRNRVELYGSEAISEV